jgi:hypothetical protein
MSDLVRLIAVPLEPLVRLGQPIGALLLQPLITVAMLLFLYAGWHVRDEGSVSAGLRVAFIDTRAFRTDHQHELEAATLQRELRKAADTDRQIDQLLAGLLVRSPMADRVRLGVVHNGITGLTGVALLRYDITNSIAAPGHTGGPMIPGLPRDRQPKPDARCDIPHLEHSRFTADWRAVTGADEGCHECRRADRGCA